MIRASCVVVLLLEVITAFGCGSATTPSVDDPLHRPRICVAREVLDRYCGTYRLANGAHYRVSRDGDRLLGGIPPRELIPQTTREFQSNQLPGEFHFEQRGTDHQMMLGRRLGKRIIWCNRIDPLREPDPTTMVSVGDHELRLLVTGSGSPAIVLEDGLGSGIEFQAEWQADLAKLSTVVSHDHAGTGGSGVGPLPRDARRVVSELREALHRAGVSPPYLLIGGSIGGEYIRLFAHQFPEETAGLILLDPTPDWERLVEWSEIHAPAHVRTIQEFANQGKEIMDRLMTVQDAGRAAEWAAMDTTREQARRAFPLPDVPLVQITGAGGRDVSPIAAAKVRFFDAWLREHLPSAKHVLAPRSGHAVVITDRQLVLEEVALMLTALKTNSSSATNSPPRPHP